MPIRKKYSGCWTCRHRHVRCDEGSPTCLRCKQAGIECKGYSIELCWVAKDQDPRIPGRPIRALPLTRYLHQADPAKVQAELDGLAEIHGEGQRGLFSVFSVPKRLNRALPSESEAEEQHLRGKNIAAVIADESMTVPTPVTQYTSAHHYKSHIEQSHPRYLCLNTRSRQQYAQLATRQPDLLLMILPEGERRLVHHWATTLSPILIPIDRVENVMTSIFLPLALSKGLPTAQSTPNGCLALFYAICAISASNLASLTPNQDEKLFLLAFGESHRQRSLTQLRQSLSIYNTSSRQDSTAIVAILATIILYITESLTSGIAQVWRSHVAGGNALCKHVSPGLWRSSRSASAVFQTFQKMNLMAMLANISPEVLASPNSPSPPPPLPPSSSRTTSTSTVSDPNIFDAVMREHGDLAYIEEALGIPSALLTTISEILIFQKTYWQETNDWAELQLSLFVPPHPYPFSLNNLPFRFPRSSSSPSASDSKLNHHHVFSYSTLICYKQSRPPYTRTSETDYLATLALPHMLALSINHSKTHHTPITWAIVIIGSEIQCRDLQAREQILTWLSERRHSGFAIYLLAEQLVREMWRFRDSGDDRGCRELWREIIRARPDLDVFWG